jgi:hypothetical protein
MNTISEDSATGAVERFDAMPSQDAGCIAMATSWPLERALFALAGTMTLLSAALAALVSPWFLLLAAFVGFNQWLYVIIGACPASMVLGRLVSLPSVVYPRSEAGVGS